MRIILSSEELKDHKVIRYQFKNLNLSDMHEAKKSNEPKNGTLSEQGDIKPKEVSAQENKVNEALHEIQQKNESFSESLLKKIDELSTNLVKMEMSLEKQQEEFSERLEEERAKSLKEGIEAGRAQMQKEIALDIEAQKKQIIESIEKMRSTADSFNEVTKNIEKDLVDAAIDIAQEVINSQLSEDSSKVALNLAKTLIEDVKGAMKIKIKANPEDCDYLKENMAANEIIEIIADRAISKGGIIIESDAGNVDGTVMTRFKAIKRNILEH